MSNHKPNENRIGKDKRDLFKLLSHLEQHDRSRGRRSSDEPFEFPEPTDLITVEDPDPDSPEENMHLQLDSFQPATMLEEDMQDILVSEEKTTRVAGENMRLELDSFQPTSMLVEDMENLLISEEKATGVSEKDAPWPEAPKQRRNPFKTLWAGFCDNLPRREDTTGTKVRKCGFLFSLLVMLVAIIYLVVDLLIIPAMNKRLKDDLLEIYHPENSNVVMSDRDGNYPKNMLASFKELYDRNSDVRGWISFHATGKKDFLDIEYPIVYRDVEDKTNPYLKTDFDGKPNRNGTLYFDQQNNVNRYTERSDALVVYGHNMASGQMFAGLNKFLGSVNNARVAPTLTLSTLFRKDEFKVFAVVLLDESDVNSRSMDIWKTEFLTDDAFMEQVGMIRARSIFDYPVDVEADDQLLVLSTCTGKTSAHVKDGRLVVVARRVRDGESTTVETNNIVKNTDVIMPYYWYINQNKKPHQYYTDIGMDQPVRPNLPTPPTASTTTTVEPDDSSTSATDESGVSTTTGTDDTTSTTTANGDTTATTSTGDTTTTTTTSSGSTTTVDGTTTGTTTGSSTTAETTTSATTTTTTTIEETPDESTTTTTTKSTEETE